MLARGNLASNCEALSEIWQFDTHDVLLHALPMFQTPRLFVALNVTPQAGSSVLLLNSFNAAEVVRLLPGVTACLNGSTDLLHAAS